MQDQLLLLAQLLHEIMDMIIGKVKWSWEPKKPQKEALENSCLQINEAFPLLSRATDHCEKHWYYLQSQARAEIAEFKQQTTATGNRTWGQLFWTTLDRNVLFSIIQCI